MGADQSLAFGDLLRRYRDAAGLTQEELAEQTGLSAEAISMLERGARRRPHAYTRLKLAEALKLGEEERAAFAVAFHRQGSTRSPSNAPTASLFAGSSAALPLVGRTQERALLARHVTGDGPPLIVLAGEPGIGKSRLLQEAGQHAIDAGWLVLHGGCQRRGGQEPYAPLLAALQSYLKTQAPATRRADLRGCAWLVRLLPELASGPIEPLPSWTLSPDQERRLMFEAVVTFLTNVAGSTGALVVLDDLQWASTDALDLLTTLAHSARSGPLRLVGAYRSTEVGAEHPLFVTLADLAQAGLALQRDLEPLAPPDATLLLAHALQSVGAGSDVQQGSPIVERLLRRTGGVPFFLLSCAQEMRDGVLEGRLDDHVPWTVTQSVRQRVAALPEMSRELVSVAAVLGRVVSRPVLATVSGRGQDEVLTALEAGCRARLLEEEGSDRCRFAHDVIREVVEADLSAARRLALHRRVADVLEGWPDEPALEAIAYHYYQGEEWSKALTYLLRAGDKAGEVYALKDALGFYAQARTAGERLGSKGLSATYAVVRKQFMLGTGITDLRADLSADLKRMLQAARVAGNRHTEGLILALQGEYSVGDHQFPVAEERLRAALTIADDGFDDVRCLASASLGGMYLFGGRHAEAESLVKTAQRLVDLLDEPFQRWGTESLVAWSANFAGRFDEASAIMERWRQASEQDSFTRQHIALGWLQGLVLAGEGDYAPALRALEDVRAVCENNELLPLGARCLNTLGWVYGDLQDHQRAIELNTRALGIALNLDLPNAEVESNARLNLGDSLLALGRLDEAEEQFEQVLRVVRNPRPEDQWMLWRYAQHLFHSYGELWLLRCDAATARSYADECLALATSSDSRKNIVKARRLRGQALLAQGQLAEADQEIAQALELARQVANPPQLWKTLAALGELRDAQGRVAEARQVYREVIQLFDVVAQGLDDLDLRVTFLTSPHVQQIRHQAQLDVPLPAPVTPTAGASRTRRLSRVGRQAWVMDHLKTGATISPRAYATALGVSVDTALLDLRDLVERGLVRAEGSTKDRRYRLRLADG